MFVRNRQASVCNVIAVPHVALDAIVESCPTPVLLAYIGDVTSKASRQMASANGDTILLAFDDESDPHHRCSMTAEQANVLALWLGQRLRAHKGEDVTVICSCAGGACRSTAMAAAIASQLHCPALAEERFFLTPRSLPNTLVFWRTLHALASAGVSRGDAAASHCTVQNSPDRWLRAFQANAEIWDEAHLR